MANSLLSDASQRLEEALKHTSISEDAIESLKFPKASLSVSIPVRMDDGSLQVFQGYRVRYDDTRVPVRAGCAITRMCRWMRCNRWRFG